MIKPEAFQSETYYTKYIEKGIKDYTEFSPFPKYLSLLPAKAIIV